MTRFIEGNYDPAEGLTLRVKPIGLRLVPEPTRGHLMTANKELLLALRSVLDHAIDKVEERERTPRRPRKVAVKGEEASATE